MRSKIGVVDFDVEHYITVLHYILAINGRSYGNLEGLNVCKGEQVVWHVMSFGQTDGLHSVTFNGNNVMIGGVYRDSHVTIPGVSFTAMMHADNVGKYIKWNTPG